MDHKFSFCFTVSRKTCYISMVHNYSLIVRCNHNVAFNQSARAQSARWHKEKKDANSGELA